MKPYQIRIPTDIYFGRDIWEASLKAVEQLLDGNMMIVTTGRSLTRLGYVERLKRQLAQCALVKDVVVFDRVSADPRLSEAKEGIALARNNKTDAVIGFGGGSAIDMAKAIAAGARSDVRIDEYFYGGREPDGAALPVIAIPTTAGTGSELSRAAILTDDEKKVKGGIRGAALYPKAAIVDSAFTESVPFRMTMQTGFDVLAHAMESYISKASSPYTQMQSEYAIRTAGRMLPRLALDLKDVEARKYMSYASMLMGINLGNAGTGLPHRLQYPLGAATGTGHGLGLAALYPAWLYYEHQYCPEETEHMLGILAGRDVRGKEECVGTMREFIALLKLPASLKELSVERARLPGLAGAVAGNLQDDPAFQEPEAVRKIYEKAWE